MKRLSITKKLMVSYILLVVAVSVLSVVMVLPGQIKDMNSHLNGTLSRVAYILASDKEIIEGLKAGKLSPELLDRLSGISEITKDLIDYIVIADENSIRLYHPNKALIGGKFAGGDEIRALDGQEDAYVTTSRGFPDVQKRAFHVVRDETGKILGFVMASTSTKSIDQHKWDMILRTGILLVISLATGLLLAIGITSSIRKILLGYDPTTFARMYLQREEILDKLNEGVFVVNQERRIIYKNLPAKSYMSGDDLSPYSPVFPGVTDCLRSNVTIPWHMVELADKSYLLSMVPLRPTENLDAVMVIMRDRTELVSLSEKLTGLNHIIDALRANTHEFRNKIHTIAGYLQLSLFDQALDYISAEMDKISSQNILRLIKDTSVAALLVGKANNAVELNIDFTIRRDSYLPENNEFIPSNELSTIIGNLLGNAFEAIGDKSDDRQIEFFINADFEGLTISVDDTGCGMTAEQIDKIMSGAYTTKGDGHGYGMRLIREIVRRRNGYLQIESDVGAGTSITVNFRAEDNSKSTPVKAAGNA